MLSNIKILSIHNVFFLISVLTVNGNSISENLFVDVNCENNICKCQSTENFNIDSVVYYLKHYDAQDTAMLACAYHQLAIGYFYEDNEAKAIQYSNKAIKLRTQFDDAWLWKSQLNLANYYNYENQYEESIKYAEKAKDQVGNPKRSKDSLLIFRLLAEGYKEIGEFEKAIQFSKKAIYINAKKEKIRDALLTYAKILVSTKDSSNLRKGIKCLDSLENIYLNEKDTINLSAVKTQLGKAFYFKQQQNKSIKYYDEALTLLLYDTLNNARLSNNIGSTFTIQEKFDYAYKYLTQSLKINRIHYKNNFQYMYAPTYENFGDYYLKLSKNDSALLYYQKTLINLTNNFRNENIFQNPNSTDTKLFIYSNPDIIRVLHLKATAAYKYYQQNKYEKYLNLANQTYQTAFNFHDKLQKDISTENSRLFQAKSILPYIENALKVAYQQQENGQDVSETAFRFMEKNKATVLLQSMNEADALQFANLPDSLLEQEKDLKIAISFHEKQLNDSIEYEDIIEIARLEKVLFEEKQQYSQLISDLENNYPNYFNLKYQQNQTKLSDVQNQLDNKTALFEYFVGDSAIYILSIQKDHSKLYEINKPNNWQQTVDNFLNTLNPKEVMKDEYTDILFNVFNHNSYGLFQGLLPQPLADLNESITNLQIIPDAELNYIPFELLLTERANRTEVNYRDLPYLLKQKSICYAYSTALLLENVNKDQQNYAHNYAGFAPQYKNTDYNNLPFAEENVQQVAQLLNGKTFIKNEATDRIFKDSIAQFKIFQLAMHGVLNDKDPLSSKLIFSNTSLKDYELHAYELYNMQIPAELGILSACETGVGKQAKGEGIMSLSRAFTYAGCSSLVMSLWKIEDMATAQIVESFFENLKKGQAKHTALQQAKLDFLNTAGSERTHPIYWAGLVQSGNAKPIDFNTANYLWWSLLLIPFCGMGIAYYLRS